MSVLSVLWLVRGVPTGAPWKAWGVPGAASREQGSRAPGAMWFPSQGLPAPLGGLGTIEPHPGQGREMRIIKKWTWSLISPY